MGRWPARRWLVQGVRHKRSVTVDVGRYHGQQIDRGDDDQEEHSDADDDRWPDRSQTRDRDVDDDQQSDPCDQRTIGIADDRLNECIVVGAAVEEAPPANEARPHKDETAQGPEREKCPNASDASGFVALTPEGMAGNSQDTRAAEAAAAGVLPCSSAFVVRSDI